MEHARDVEVQNFSPATTRRHGPIVGCNELCFMCNKIVYQMEKLTADEKIYHKTCFKCFKCKRTLDVRTYAVNEKVLYCKPHFMELFKLRGHYQDRNTLLNNQALVAGHSSAHATSDSNKQLEVDGINGVASLSLHSDEKSTVCEPSNNKINNPPCNNDEKEKVSKGCSESDSSLSAAFNDKLLQSKELSTG